MWTLTGPFDGELNDVANQKTKLLKTDGSYMVGRKDVSLVINNKKISREHGEFHVGKLSVEDASNPQYIPTLHYVAKKKPFSLERDGDSHNIPPNKPKELKNGDILAVTAGIPLKIQWSQVCCFDGEGKPKVQGKLRESCASLGIHFALEPSAGVTHHLTSLLSATPSIAASLISSCYFVKPDWLQEIVRLGSLPSATPLEDAFPLPPIHQYRPSLSTTLSSSHSVYKIWEPNEARMNLFRKYRFLCVGEKARELSLDMRNLINRGQGSIEVFDVHSGPTKLQQAIKRGFSKEGKTLVLLGDEGLLSIAIGKDAWNDLVLEAKQAGLSFVSPDSLVQAVLDVDTSVLETGSSHIQLDKSRVDSTGAESPAVVSEPVVTPPPEAPKRRIKLTRRVNIEPRSQSADPVPATPSVPAVVEAGEGEEPKAEERPRRRRLGPRNVFTTETPVPGVDDPSGILTEAPDLGPRKDSEMPPPPAPAERPTKRYGLKRRVGLTDSGPSAPAGVSGLSASIVEDSYREPPLKKFKALFEASDPGRMESGTVEESQGDAFEPLDSGGLSSQTQTETQSKTQSGPRNGTVVSLSALREEEEEESVAPSLGGKKRSLDDVNEDVEMEDATNGDAAMGEHPAKKRATEDNRVVSGDAAAANAPARGTSKAPTSQVENGTSKGAKGAAVGKPDKDVAFLKAVASKKRGKKGEDEFDKEFNKLKISKPDLNEPEPEKEWAVLADFGDDSGIRGNFMNICEMEVFKEKNGQERAGRIEDHPGWQGKPNFKKFKKKNAPSSRPKVDLYVNEGGDGMGIGSWKDGFSQATSKTKARQRGMPLDTLDEDQELSDAFPEQPIEVPAPRRTRAGSTKPPSRAGSAVPTRSSRRGKASRSETPLFLDDEESQTMTMGSQLTLDDDDDIESVDTSVGRATSKTKAKAKGAAAPAKKPTKSRKPVIVHDDSDDDAVFKGF